MLTKEQIVAILDIIGRKVVVNPTDAFPYYITERSSFGYSEDRDIGAIQAALSIMLSLKGKK